VGLTYSGVDVHEKFLSSLAYDSDVDMVSSNLSFPYERKEDWKTDKIFYKLQY
jgi:hypothetical protein